MPDAPPKGKLFPCEKCGAKIEFDPVSRSLKCPYCAAVNDIPDTDDKVTELSLEEWMAKLESESETHQRPASRSNAVGVLGHDSGWRTIEMGI